MVTKLPFIILLAVVYECNGHLPILGDIISNAHKRIHSTVEGVAGAVLGGLNLNFGGHVGFRKQERPQYFPQKDPEETVIVVVEENSDNNYRPPHPNNYNPSHDGHRPHFRPGPGYNDQNQGPYNENEYNNQRNPGNSENGGNYFENFNQNGQYDQNKGNYNNNGESTESQFNQNYPERPVEQENPYNNGNPEQVNNKPTTEYIKSTVYIEPRPTTSTIPADDEKNKVPETSDDSPLFIPLNPDEYVYGGDKINITAPKRETEKSKQTETDDEDFGIDVRLKNE